MASLTPLLSPTLTLEGLDARVRALEARVG